MAKLLKACAVSGSLSISYLYKDSRPKEIFQSFWSVGISVSQAAAWRLELHNHVHVFTGVHVAGGGMCE